MQLVKHKVVCGVHSWCDLPAENQNQSQCIYVVMHMHGHLQEKCGMAHSQQRGAARLAIFILVTHTDSNTRAQEVAMASPARSLQTMAGCAPATALIVRLVRPF